MISDEAAGEETARLLGQLKRAFRAAGLRYADVAARLGVSEMTVKRHMAGRGLSLAMLQRLCATAGLTLAELVALAEEGGGQEQATPAQTRAIAADIVLGMTYFLLNRGWSPRRIARELRLEEPVLTGHLVRLDRLGVIELHPGDRVRLKRVMNTDIREEPTQFALVARRVHQFFDRPDLHDPRLRWSSGIARLSRASAAEAARLMDGLRDAVFALGERDFDLPADEVDWHTLFFALRPVGIGELLYEPPDAGD